MYGPSSIASPVESLDVPAHCSVLQAAVPISLAHVCMLLVTHWLQVLAHCRRIAVVTMGPLGPENEVLRVWPLQVTLHTQVRWPIFSAALLESAAAALVVAGA